MQAIWQNMRYGVRMMLKKPGFTFVAVITIALGIGATTAIFSVVNGVLLKSLPYPEAQRLVVINETSKESPTMAVAYQNYLDWRAQQTVFEDLAARMPAGGIITGDGEPERVIGRYVTASFFPTLGIQPHIGRFFTEEEDRPGAQRVMVLSYALWQRRYGADASALGKAIQYSGDSWTIVGVMPANFDFYGQTNLNNDIFIPLGRSASERFMQNRNTHTTSVLARLKPGVTREQAESELKAIAGQLAEQYPASNAGNSIRIRTFLEDYVGDVRPGLLMIVVAVGLVLAIACANVANLLLARAASRRKEVAVRMALGASRWQIVRQLLTESAMLALAGGTLGLFIAMWGVELLISLNPDALPRVEEITIDPNVLGFTLLVTLLTSVLFGLAPAMQTTKVNFQDTLKEGGRQSSVSGSHQRLRSALVIAEVALSLVLLVGAGLLLRSFQQLMLVDPGFDARNVLTMRMRLNDGKYPESAQSIAFLNEVTRRVEALPGVVQASVTTGFPFGRGGDDTYWVEGEPEPRQPGEWSTAVTHAVGENYYKTMGIALLAGRYFTEQDNANSSPVVIVDDSLVEKHFPQQSLDSAIGKRLRFSGTNEQWREIVGVVRHVRQNSLDEEGFPGIYRPWMQLEPTFLTSMSRAMDLVIKTNTEPTSYLAAIKQEVQAVDKDQPLANVNTLEALLAQSIATRRFNLMLLAVFALVALLVGSVGLYGVMSYMVSQRTNEIGIRIALGARTSDVLGMVLKQGLVLTLTGIAAGIGASLLLTRLMSSLLFGVSATDPFIFTLVAALLAIVALIACFVPARRATKVDPMVALRYE
jgi:putative ABC transport system permease protein